MGADIRLDLFCRVIDNYGDAGVCYRLARQLAREYPMQVRLWIDQVAVLRKITGESALPLYERRVGRVEIREWSDPFLIAKATPLPDVVVEGFGCRLPDNYIFAMAARQVQPLWINMEYLSAEPWVEDCHGVISLLSETLLKKYFFFPGFTPQTGGLIRESYLTRARRRFQQDSTARVFLFNRLGIRENATYFLSLFCYEHAPVLLLFEILAQQNRQQVCCVVPEGVASQQVSLFLGMPAKVGLARTKGGLTVRVIPFVDQDTYDKLLWSCDLNIVRGEDSFVRAQWAARPFIWHIYPQAEQAHFPKLYAFLDRYLAGLSASVAEVVRQVWVMWNDAKTAQGNPVAIWEEIFFSALPDVARHAAVWEEKLAKKEDFAASLFRFVQRMR